MSQSIKLEKLKVAPAKKYKLQDGIVLEKTENDEIIISSETNQYKTVRIYESNNPNVFGTIEIQNNPEYSMRINLRENSDIAVDPSKNNSAILFKAPKSDFVGSYVVRPSQANFIRAHLNEWKENLKVAIEPATLNQFEEMAKEYMEENKVSSCEFDAKIGEKSCKLTFTATKSADLLSTVNDIKSKRLNRTEPLSEKQQALLAKYDALVKAEKEGKVLGLSISLGNRELRHSFWNPADELGGVEHVELQKKFKTAQPKTTAKTEEKPEELGNIDDIIA